jgi:phage shock protein A
MGRCHRNKAPVPKTTWAISLELDERISKAKGRHDIIDDFIRKVFEQWQEWKDTIPFMEEAYEKQSQIVEGYVKQIRELKKQQLQLEMIIANH